MVRSGTHCCHPFFDGIGRSGALRLSAYLYNTEDEIERATDALRRALVGLQR
jgi:cysteine desulfurase/selenocysteine lyase